MMKNMTHALRRSTQCLVLTLLTCCTLISIANASDDKHRREYDEALDIAMNSESRIIIEMKRIRSGTVAHYDFLQFAHIELLRHAKALTFPPVTVSSADRELIKRQAKELVTRSEDLEWVIADYLRAFAQVNSATHNTLDILNTLTAQDNDPRSISLAKTIAQLIASDYGKDWRSIGPQFTALIDSDINQQAKTELQFQQRKLRENLPRLEMLIQEAGRSDTEEVGRKIKAILEQKA